VCVRVGGCGSGVASMQPCVCGADAAISLSRHIFLSPSPESLSHHFVSQPSLHDFVSERSFLSEASHCVHEKEAISSSASTHTPTYIEQEVVFMCVCVGRGEDDLVGGFPNGRHG